MESAERGDLCEDFLDVKLVLDERLLQIVEGVLTVGCGGLFDGVMEELAEEGAMSVSRFDDMIDDVPGTCELDFFILVEREFGDWVNGFVLVFGAPATNSVEVFQRKSQGVDEGVAGHAIAVPGEFRDFFPHGESGFEMALLEGDGHWR